MTRSLEDYDLARRLLAYHRLDQQMAPSDCIIVLGSYDLRVADRAAELFFERLAPLLVFSGRCGELTKKIFPRTEAEEFAERAIRLGVPEDHIILETDSTNTGENVRFSKQVLLRRGVVPSSAIAVQKPYMERRTFATFAKLWPELKLLVTSPALPFEDLALPFLDQRGVIEVMVGDLQRVIEYPRLGFQSPQEVPAGVIAAYEELVRRGYTGRLIKSL